MALAISITPEGFKEAERMLQGIKNGFPRAAADAINRGLKAGRKVAVMGIRARYNIKSADVKNEGLKVKQARWTHLDGSLEAKGRMLPVRLFEPKVRLKKGKRFVSVAIIRGQRKVLKGAFKISSGQIMERRQASKYPIFPVSTIGVPYMIRYQKIAEKIQRTITETIARRMAHNVAFFMSKARIGSAKP